MGDLSRNHPPRALLLSHSDHSSPQAAYSLERKATSKPSHHDYPDAFHSQHARYAAQDQLSHVPPRFDQGIMAYPTNVAPAHNSPYNMALMVASLPSLPNQGIPYPPSHPAMQHGHTAYPSHPSHIYAAQQIPQTPPYHQAYHTIPYPPVGPQTYPSYQPHVYNAYSVYTPQPNAVYPPDTLSSYPHHMQDTNQGFANNSENSNSVARFNYAGSSSTPYGPPAERHMDTRASYLQRGLPSAVVSSAGNATYSTSLDYSRQSYMPIGPPRKPRQSGHALWVGNLPPGATVTDLKDHFSRGATKDIESLKLISKSNCAFVNYRTHAACIAAMDRFLDSRFHGVRLVCRLRRTSVGKSSSVSPSIESPSDGQLNEGHSETENATTDSLPDQNSNRYFILKSLTLHDLEISTQTGTWTTQPHNEDALNDAFKAAENVYLIFSANKSGEYFGYARMCSPIPTTPSSPNDTSKPKPPTITPAARKSLPKPDDELTLTTEIVSTIDLGPKALPTPPTEWAPKGRIIDDFARGTIFWEADTDDEAEEPRSCDETSSAPEVAGAAAAAPLTTKNPSPSSSLPDPLPSPSTQHSSLSSDQASHAHADSEVLGGSSGNAFQVQWLSTRRIPFSRARGLRNRWNADREVKIARDGTKLETGVGGRLVGLFGAPVVLRRGRGVTWEGR